MRSGWEKRHVRFFEKLTAARRGIIKFLCANEIIREAVEMNGQESRTCQVAAFVSIDRNAFVIRRKRRRRVPRRIAASASGERRVKWGWTGGRSPLTSRQSGAAEVSMTPVRRRSADAARRDQRGSPRRAPSLKRRNHYYGPSCGGSEWKCSVLLFVEKTHRKYGKWMRWIHRYNIFFHDVRVYSQNYQCMKDWAFERISQILFAKCRQHPGTNMTCSRSIERIRGGLLYICDGPMAGTPSSRTH